MILSSIYHSQLSLSFATFVYPDSVNIAVHLKCIYELFKYNSCIYYLLFKYIYKMYLVFKYISVIYLVLNYNIHCI